MRVNGILLLKLLTECLDYIRALPGSLSYLYFVKQSGLLEGSLSHYIGMLTNPRLVHIRLWGDGSGVGVVKHRDNTASGQKPRTSKQKQDPEPEVPWS